MARHLGLARTLVLAIVALLAAALTTALPAAAQDPDQIRAVLEDSLLRKADLPKGFTSQDGIVQGSNFDIDRDAFENNNGLGVVSQVWQRQAASGPIIVFDFRLLFPTPEDAQAYLLEAEDVISERDASDLKLKGNEPPIGDLHRLYQGSTTVSGQKFAFNNHLLTVGAIAAKIFVSGATGSANAARTIAEDAARRMGDAQIGAPIVTPTPQPTPEPTPEPTPAPTAVPLPSVEPGPDLSAVFEAALIARVGPGIDPTTCGPVLERAFPGELAGISCPIGDQDEIVVMRQMASTQALLDAFVPFRGDKNGPTGTCATEPALEPRLDGDAQVGELACYDTSDPSRVFIWTDERFDTMSWIVGTQERSFADLDELYLSAGPVPAGDGPVPTPDPVIEPTPAPTPEPTPQPTPQPTPGPTAGPAGTIPPGLSDAQAELASHVPSAFVGTCRSATINVDADATAAILCTPTIGGGSVSVTFQQFPDQSSMDAAYDKNLAFLGATKDSGPCSGDWPAENTWNLDGEVTGRVACAEVGGFSRNMAWTDDRLQIAAFAETFDVAKEDLHQWWLDESGPIP